MLARSTYDRDYVNAIRAQIAGDAAAFASANAGEALEPVFFNDLVLVLELSFVHRLRGKEGKDGNPLNEVRVLASSLLEHGGVYTPQKSIRHKPESSVLGHAAGDRIALDAADFERLADAFFGELEAKFV
jgi:hypothetical protein